MFTMFHLLAVRVKGIFCHLDIYTVLERVLIVSLKYQMWRIPESSPNSKPSCLVYLTLLSHELMTKIRLELFLSMQ